MKLSHCEKKNWNATNGLEVYRFNKKAKKSFRFHFDCFVFEISLEKKQLILHETSDFLHAVYMCFERTWSLPAVRVSPAKLITRTGENLAEDFRQNYEWQQLNLTDIGMFFQGNMQAKIPLWMSKNCPPTLIFFRLSKDVTSSRHLLDWFLKTFVGYCSKQTLPDGENRSFFLLKGRKRRIKAKTEQGSIVTLQHLFMLAF